MKYKHEHLFYKLIFNTLKLNTIKMFKKSIFLLVLSIILFSCEREIHEDQTILNPNVQVESRSHCEQLACYAFMEHLGTSQDCCTYETMQWTDYYNEEDCECVLTGIDLKVTWYDNDCGFVQVKLGTISVSNDQFTSFTSMHEVISGGSSCSANVNSIFNSSFVELGDNNTFDIGFNYYNMPTYFEDWSLSYDFIYDCDGETCSHSANSSWTQYFTVDCIPPSSCPPRPVCYCECYEEDYDIIGEYHLIQEIVDCDDERSCEEILSENPLFDCKGKPQVLEDTKPDVVIGATQDECYCQCEEEDLGGDPGDYTVVLTKIDCNDTRSCDEILDDPLLFDCIKIKK